MKSIKYRFSPNVSKKKVGLIKLIDKGLNFIIPKPANKQIFLIETITITQLAHIGDLILLLPGLKKLKMLSNYKIKLVVSSQNFSMANKLNFVDEVIIADAPYFLRQKKGSYFKFISQLKKIKTDLIFDVRGDLRNNFFIKLFTNHKVFAGYNVAGGDALLDLVLPYPHGQHITGLLNSLFDYLKFPQIDFSVCWHEKDVPYDVVCDISFPENFMVVHLGAGAQSRRWDVENFLKIVKNLSQTISVYILGTPEDLSEQQLKQFDSMPNVTVCVGKYNILQSIYILKQSSVFLGLDSGFSHVAAMLKKKVFVLFSGTANKNVWRPYNFYENQVTLIKHDVECDCVTGCGKLICADNICMKHIYTLDVITAVKKHLNKSVDLIRNN
jgi:heptosyltransferase-2